MDNDLIGKKFDEFKTIIPNLSIQQLNSLKAAIADAESSCESLAAIREAGRRRSRRFREKLKQNQHSRNVTPLVTLRSEKTEQNQYPRNGSVTYYYSSKKERKKDYTEEVSEYAFSDGIIKLNQKDFQVWQKSYSYLDLPAELLSLSEWAGRQGPKWFHAVKGALAKRNRAAKAAKENPIAVTNERSFDPRKCIIS